jgi:methionine biosynthesis protein MetW
MSLALQAVRFPDLILDEMLQIGRECIVTFPNFGHWSCRHDIGLRGRMPRSDFLPHEWYNTPNIHFCTIADFEALCRKKNFQILNQRVVDRHYRSNPLMRRWPNLLAEIAIYRLTR